MNSVLDFQWLLRMPGAEARFSHFAHASSTATRMYGACGLYLSRSERSRAGLEALLNDESDAMVLNGCLASTLKVKDVARDPERYCEPMRPTHSFSLLWEVRRLTGRGS